MRSDPYSSFHDAILKHKKGLGYGAAIPFPDSTDIERMGAKANIDPRFDEDHLTVQQIEARAIDSLIAGHYTNPRYAHYADLYALFCEPLGARPINALVLDAAIVKSELNDWEQDMRIQGAEIMKAMPGFHDCDILTHDQLLNRLFGNDGGLPSRPAF